MTDAPFISINQAAASGITKLRRPIWAHPMDHLVIDIIDGEPGIFIRLYCPSNVGVNGRDPVEMITLDVDLHQETYVPYEGFGHESPEYIAMSEKYTQSFKAHCD